MPQSNPIILLTRPKGQANAFRDLLGKNVDVIISPVFRIENLEVKYDLENYSALIFASQNAVIAFAKVVGTQGIDAYVVGKKTAALASKFGLNVVTIKTTANDLIDTIIVDNPRGKLLFLRGKYSTGNIEQKLNLVGIDTVSKIVYEQEPVNLSLKILAILQTNRPVILPLFSCRSAQLLSDQVKRANCSAPLIIVAISTAVLDAWCGPEPDEFYVASDPTGQAMVKEIMRRFR